MCVGIYSLHFPLEIFQMVRTFRFTNILSRCLTQYQIRLLRLYFIPSEIYISQFCMFFIRFVWSPGEGRAPLLISNLDIDGSATGILYIFTEHIIVGYFFKFVDIFHTWLEMPKNYIWIIYYSLFCINGQVKKLDKKYFYSVVFII